MYDSVLWLNTFELVFGTRVTIENSYFVLAWASDLLTSESLVALRKHRVKVATMLQEDSHFMPLLPSWECATLTCIFLSRMPS